MSSRLLLLGALLGALTPSGASVAPASLAGWTLDGEGARLGAVQIGLVEIGRDGAAVALGEGRLERRDDEIRIHRAPGVVEWWRPMAAGLEQGVTLDVRPAGEGELVLGMSAGAHVRPRLSGDDVVLEDEAGTPLAGYSQLVVLDADGARVPARLAVVEHRIAIRIDDRDARYPLVVDPFVVELEATFAPPSGLSAASWGNSVSMSADGARLLIGVPSADSVRGAAYVYVRSGSGWVEEGVLAPDASLSQQFGAAVAISADGSHAVIGAPSLLDAGRAYVFRRAPGLGWTRDYVAVPRTTLDGGGMITPDRFGSAVALSRDGATVIVGAPGTDGNRGSIHIYSNVGMWDVRATRAAFNRSPGDLYGSAVALSADGTTAFVGAPGDELSPAPADVGTLDVWSFDGTAWGRLLSEWQVPGAAAGAGVGRSLSVSADSLEVLVGGLSDAFALEWSGTLTLEASLAAVVGTAIDGRVVALSQDGTIAAIGAAGGVTRVLSRSPTWSFVATAPTPVGALGFGTALALDGSGTRLAVGAPAGSAASRVFVYGVGTNGLTCTGTDDCRSGFCVDGVCCDTACGGGAADDCAACSAALTGGAAGTCAALSASVAPSVTCRVATEGCDVAEVCLAGSTVCPTDRFSTGGTLCRAVAGGCDVEERCTGTGAACPVDAFVAAGTECRAATLECDVVEECSGDAAACPPDAFLSAETSCGAAPSGVCDAPDHCAGTSSACVETFLVAVECRASAGGCDPPELCGGTASGCPPDVVSPGGTVCRTSSDIACDPLESCDGVSPACPADQNTCGGDSGGGVDAGGADAGGPTATAGCSCRVSPRASAGPVALALGLLLVLLRRR